MPITIFKKQGKTIAEAGFNRQSANEQLLMQLKKEIINEIHENLLKEMLYKRERQY
ncbi:MULTISPECIES: hypothetical protein [Flavobacterium]|uniref:hypothetical protein n=1 Tax=Flavobacterium TaxID=237 RepID=UPI0015AD4966|nr:MULTISPECIES: hypothetical protein [Flavobacterium]MBN9283705.1 hypothetical protein [Flavobacterium sp.]